MNYQLSNTADGALLSQLGSLAARDRATTAALLAHISEVDRRRLYRGRAYPSMLDYCVGELRMSEDMASKRVRVARAAREHPAILPAVESGELSLSTAVLLARHLTPDNAADLIAAARFRTRRDVERLIAERFPQRDLPTVLVPASGAAPGDASSEPALELSSAPGRMENIGVLPKNVSSCAASPAAPASTHARLKPLSSDRSALQVTLSRRAHELLEYARELDSHAVPSRDIAKLLERALESHVEKLERRKFAKSAHPGRSRGSANPRYVPAGVKRAVVERDRGQCTFVAPNRHRCEARARLEFDHIVPVAQGGQSTVMNLRLRCRAHNQLEAERRFGRELVSTRVEQARLRRAEERGREEPQRRAQKRASADVPQHTDAAAEAQAEAQIEVIPWLRQLGFSAAEARRGATQCAGMADAPLEERVRVALRSLAPASARTTPSSPRAAP